MKTWARIERYMSRNPYWIEATDSLDLAAEAMRTYKVRHLPVMDEEMLCGVLTERDLREAQALSVASTLCVGDVMKGDVYEVSCDAPMKDVLSFMAERRLGSVVVLDRRGDVAGIFTTTDALELLADFFSDLGAQDEHEDRGGASGSRPL